MAEMNVSTIDMMECGVTSAQVLDGLDQHALVQAHLVVAELRDFGAGTAGPTPSINV